jgi:hypothetical protein
MRLGRRAAQGLTVCRTRGPDGGNQGCGVGIGPDARPIGHVCKCPSAAQGTTTNGACLLPFKTGAFLAGAPVRPVVLEYGADRVSAAWESINFVWHALLMLANATHSVTAYEVRAQRALPSPGLRCEDCGAPTQRRARRAQLPVYVPSEAERADPALYAANVRDMMLRVGGFKPSPASLQDSRAYIALLQARPWPRARQIDAWGPGLPAAHAHVAVFCGCAVRGFR